jgi:DUF4097 and DUF4098 domain-containing protein YvlB
MTPLSTLRSLVAVCALTSAACSVDLGGEGAILNEEKRFPVNGNIELSLTTFDGAIEVRSWDRNEVLVRIERRAPTAQEAQALTVQATQEGNRIVVDAPGRDRVRSGPREGFHFGVWRSPTVSFIVNVPRRVTLTARTSDGAIEATDLAGTITLETEDGSIHADRVEGDVKAHTGDGSIVAADVRGRADLDSGDGSIRVTGRFEDLRIHSGDGSVDAEAGEGSAMKRDWSISTEDGSITLRLPAIFDAEIDAESDDGRVNADGIGASSTRDDDDRGVARGRLGKGGHVLRVRSGDGPIEIRTR